MKEKGMWLQQREIQGYDPTDADHPELDRKDICSMKQPLIQKHSS